MPPCLYAFLYAKEDPCQAYFVGKTGKFSFVFSMGFCSLPRMGNYQKWKIVTFWFLNSKSVYGMLFYAKKKNNPKTKPQNYLVHFPFDV